MMIHSPQNNPDRKQNLNISSMDHAQPLKDISLKFDRNFWAIWPLANQKWPIQKRNLFLCFA